MIVVLTVILSTILQCAIGTTEPRYLPIIKRIPRTYKVNLDDPPIKRWQEVITDYKPAIQLYASRYDQQSQIFNGVEWYAKNVWKYREFAEQVDAISKLSGVSFDKIFLINFYYEYDTVRACTGIIVRTQDNKIMHGRNFDHRPFQLMANLLLVVQFYKGGKLLYISEHIAGGISALTSFKPGSFSINVNSRETFHRQLSLLELMKVGEIPTLYLVRKIMQEQTTYSAAYHRLNTTVMLSSAYFIIAGINPNQGGVIQRQTNSTFSQFHLDQKNWFLVHSNYDREEMEPKNDSRRIAVERKLQKMGVKGFTQQTLMDDFLAKWPTFDIASTMSVVMVPKTGYHKMIIWYGQDPQKPQLSKHK